MRQIMDELVKKNIRSRGDRYYYLLTLPTYQGVVEENIEKVSVKPVSYDMRRVSITSELDERYKSLKLVDTEFWLEFRGNRYSTTEQEIRMLKSLIIEQINKNVTYSKLVASIVVQVVNYIASGRTGVIKWRELDDLNAVYNTVYEELCQYVKNELGY